MDAPSIRTANGDVTVQVAQGQHVGYTVGGDTVLIDQIPEGAFDS